MNNVPRPAPSCNIKPHHKIPPFTALAARLSGRLAANDRNQLVMPAISSKTDVSKTVLNLLVSIPKYLYVFTKFDVLYFFYTIMTTTSTATFSHRD